MPSKTSLAVVEPADSSLSGLAAGRIVNAFAKIIDRRSTVQTLCCVRLCSEGSTLTISGMDLDHFLGCEVPFDGAPFDVLVQEDGLAGALQAFGDEAPRLRTVPGPGDGLRFEASGGAGTFQFDAYPGSELPDLAFGEVKVEFSVRADVLKSAFEALYKAISTEETRYYLNGVCMTWKDGAIEFAATDGHRLHVFHHPPTSPDARVPAFDQLIIHRKAVRALMDLLGRADVDKVAIRIAERGPRARTVEFTIANWSLCTKAIDGTFPDYSRIIPQDLKGSLTAKVSELLPRAKVISDMDRGRGRGAAIKLDLKDLAVSCRGAWPAQYMAGINGKVVGDPPLEIAFNADKLVDLLSVAGGEGSATVHFGPDAASPAKIELSAQPAFFGVLMPMRA